MKKISKILLSVLVLFTTGKALAQSQAAKDEKNPGGIFCKEPHQSYKNSIGPVLHYEQEGQRRERQSRPIC